MAFKKHIISCVALLIAVVMAPPPVLAQAAFGNLSQSITWPSNSISWTQLQNIFSRYPGMNQFNIQFPSGSQWNVQPSTMQTLYNSYVQNGQSLGYGGASNPLPGLVFSALKSSGINNLSFANVPIGNGINAMEQQTEDVLRQMRYDQMHLSDSLPEWLKNLILMTWNGLSQIGSFAWEKASSVF